MPLQLDLPIHRLERTPVLLLGGVNLVRALGEAGIPAVVASYEHDEPAFASRYCVGRCALPPLDHDAAVDAIVAVGDRLSAVYGRRVPLMYGSDDYLELIYTHRERLERYFLLLLNDADVADALLVKDRFQAFAESRGIPVPRWLTWDSLQGVESPVLVKPSNKVDWKESAMRRRLFHDAKAMVFASGAQAYGDPTVAAFREQLTFQEYVAGDDTCIWSYHAVADEKGAVLDSFVGRKLRTYPSRTGESSFIELDEDDEICAMGAEIAARVPLKGVFKIDFKRDPRTGRLYVLEINARFNLWHYLGAVNGVNLLAVAYEYLLEGARPLHPRAYDGRYRWLSFELDVRAFFDLRRRNEISLPGWLASLAFTRKVYNVFAWDDPGPWLSFWSHRLTRRWDRGAARFFSFFRRWLSTAS